MQLELSCHVGGQHHISHHHYHHFYIYTSYFYIIQASEDIGDLYDLDMHPEIEDEVADLITIIADAKEGNTTTEIDPAAATQRLFEIFIQTEDMAKYTKDFNEFAAILGNPNTEDPFDWSQFDLQTDKDLKKQSEEMQALEEPQREEQREMAKMLKMMKLRGDDVGDDDYDEEGEYDDEGEYDEEVEYDDDGDEEDVDEDDKDEDEYVEDSGKRLEVNDNKEKDFDRGHEVEGIEGIENLDAFARQNRPFDDDFNDQSSGDKSMDEFIRSKMNADENLNLKFNQKLELQDEDGNVWSACLIDTDVVQKVTPGQRVNSYRALAVIGNGKGAAGFGMGKGKNGQEALYSACRYVRP